MYVKMAEHIPSCSLHDVDFGVKMAGFDSPHVYYESAQASN